MEQQISMEQDVRVEEPMVLEDIIIETVAIDGICGVY